MSPRRNSRDGRVRGDAQSPAYPTLDLHGHSVESAVQTTKRWLAQQRAADSPIVRVITGRGLHSASGPVIRSAVESLLKEMMGLEIERFERDVTGGSFRIILRPPPRIRVRRRIAASPALVRQAEESLTELGIKPTPELVEAEIARILRDRSD